jgi:CRP-like cAMP-binding protein
VGEISLLTGEPRSATVRAVTPCVGYEIGGEVFRALIRRRPEIAEKVARVVAERKLRNAEVERRLTEAQRAEEVDTFAGQLVKRMRQFFGLGPKDRAAADSAAAMI